MRKNKSKVASKRYPNLYKYPGTSYWVFRKYCKEKRAEFRRSTGSEIDDSKAYKKGLDLFNEWLGTTLALGRPVLIKDLARSILETKHSRRPNTYKSAENQFLNHIVPEFGHLRPEQLTSHRWDQYDSKERTRPKRTKLFNTRKHVIEIMHRAYDEGLIKRIPKYKNYDAEPRLGKYLDEITVRRIINAATSPDTKLLAEWIYRMGARPGEILQYTYEMIVWDEDQHGRIYIPGSITKTGRSRTIPLNSVIASLVAKRRDESPSRFIFPSPSYSERPMAGYKTGWNTACERAGVKATIYDLRHTWVTDQAKRGINIIFTAKYADTSVKMIEKVYMKAEPHFMQEVAG